MLVDCEGMYGYSLFKRLGESNNPLIYEIMKSSRNCAGDEIHVLLSHLLSNLAVDFMMIKKIDAMQVNNAGVGGVIVDCEALRALKLGAGEIVGEKSDLVKGVMQQTYEIAEECLKTNYYGCKAATEALLPLLQLSSSARIVNVSSDMGQLKFISNQRAREYLDGVDGPTEEKVEEVLQWFLKDFKEDLLGPNGWPTMLAAYSVSKAALNAYTRILAKRYPGFCINCVSPGFVKTDMNCNTGILTVEDGAKAPVMLALLPDGGPSGLFFDQMELSTFA